MWKPNILNEKDKLELTYVLDTVDAYVEKYKNFFEEMMKKERIKNILTNEQKEDVMQRFGIIKLFKMNKTIETIRKWIMNTLFSGIIPM